MNRGKDRRRHSHFPRIPCLVDKNYCADAVNAYAHLIVDNAHSRRKKAKARLFDFYE